MYAERLLRGLKPSQFVGVAAGLLHVRFGSLADILRRGGHVRFTPESGHVRCNYRCLQRPEARHESSDAHRKQTPG